MSVGWGEPLSVLPRGMMHCPVTPLDADGHLDLATFDRLIEFHIAAGATSLCVLLHVAESLNLSLDERKTLAARAVDAAAGRVPVIVHVSAPGTAHAVELARHAEAAGANAVCVLSPYYWPVPEDAIEAHFAAVLDSVRIGVMAYNSPNFQGGVALRPALIVRLLERHPHFIGLKEASHSFESFIELRRAAHAVRPDFGLILGVEYVLPAVALGGVGAMSVFGSIAPRLVAALHREVEAGAWSRAQPLQDKASALWQLMKPEYPAPIKAGMAMLGRPVGPVRGPMRSLSGAQQLRLQEALAALGVLDSEPRGW
jgi:4-hydroxy-tetrahydrodipicolinate synthase